MASIGGTDMARVAGRAIATGVFLAAVLVLGGCVPEAGAPSPTPAKPSSGLVATDSPHSSIPDSPAAGTALAALSALPTKGRAPLSGYNRAAFGPTWTDDNNDQGGHNGCDTRNDILRRDLIELVLKPGTRDCLVLSGVLHDNYTGATISFRRGVGSSNAVQIDHVVSLADAWQTGAQQLDAERRVDLANDPLELLAVDGSTNASKGDGDAATWLPPAKAYRCRYVARQIAVKTAYRLWVTAAERTAMERVLTRCPDERLPGGAGGGSS
jgi:hypothetical protein